MRQRPINDPAYRRKRAEEARRIAKALADPISKEMMLNIARSCGKLEKITEEGPVA